MQRGSRDERGFTMVEMIITIAIMAILAGIIEVHIRSSSLEMHQNRHPDFWEGWIPRR